jgi:glycerate dehydrogenase
MEIVVLDGHTANPGDLDWTPLEELGDLKVYDRTAPDQVLARIGDAGAVITNKVPFDAARLQQFPQLQYIGVTATGYNIIDVAAARQHQVTVTNIPAYSTASVAQMTFALLLELTQQVGLHAAAVASGRWSAAPDFCFWDKPLVELEGKTLGLVGYGQIARRVALIASAFGMQIVTTTRNPAKYLDHPLEVPTRFASLDELLQESDVVSLHCPLTDETSRLINAARLAQMKPSALLLNTSRGAVVDEAALADALNNDRLAGAGLDVLSSEPPAADNPLLSARNCLITPHIAWATGAARKRLLDVAIANLKAFLHGRPQNVVS